MSQYPLGEDAARFGVVSFNHAAPLRVNISYDATEINAGIDEMVAGGGTLISAGFDKARQLFADQARVNATKIALLLSDGYGGTGAVAAAALIKADNVTVFAWGFGGANLANLEQLASDPSKAVLGTNLTDLASYLEPLQAAVCALPPPSLPPPSPPPPRPSMPCTSFDGEVWSDEFKKWVYTLFQMADADTSGTINDNDELAMLLSYLNLEPSEDCADKLKSLFDQSLNTDPRGISFSDFFAWLQDCLPQGHVWRDCPPSAPPSPSPPSSPCVDTTKCKKKKCKNYDAAKLQTCKKTCGLCEPLPPSAPPPPPSPPPPPPPPALPEVDCSGLSDKKKCKIKKKKCKTKKQLIKCGKKCKQDRKKKKLCQRTCCELGFPV